MKRIISIIMCMFIIALAGCQVNIGSDSESSSDTSSEAVTTKATTTETTQVKPVIEPEVKKLSGKITSKDGFFSLYYEIPTLELKANQEYKLITKFKNESKNDFKIGIKDMTKPVNIAIIKKGEIWGYEGNDIDICSTMKAGQEVTQETKIKLKEPGEYQFFIFIDFARDIKASEDASKVDKNLYHPARGNTSIAVEELKLTVK